MWNTLCGQDIDQIEKELFDWIASEFEEEEEGVISKEKIKAAVEKSGELITKHFEKKHFENFFGKKGGGKHKKEGEKQEKKDEKQSYSKHEIFRILFDRIKPNSEFDIFLINKVRIACPVICTFN